MATNNPDYPTPFEEGDLELFTMKQIYSQLAKSGDSVIGHTCDCCGMYHQTQKRVLQPALVAFLVALADLIHNSRTNQKYFHVDYVFSHCKQLTGFKGKDYSVLWHFHLIEKEDDAKRTGRWTVSDIGWEFLQGKRRISDHYYKIPIVEKQYIYSTKRILISEVWDKDLPDFLDTNKLFGT